MPKPNGQPGKLVFTGLEWAKLAAMFTAICAGVFGAGVWYSGVNSKLTAIEDKVTRIETTMVNTSELQECRKAIDRNTLATHENAGRISTHVESFHTKKGGE